MLTSSSNKSPIKATHSDDDDDRHDKLCKDPESGASSPPSALAANNNNNNNPAGLTPLKLALLTAMVCQNTTTILVTRYTRSNASPGNAYEISHLIFTIEVAKFVLACAAEHWTSSFQLVQQLQRHVQQRPWDAARMAVPALLYLVQNNLQYVALSNLTAPMFQVTNQAKLVTTALVSVLLLQRSYSCQQWICLVGISCGVAMVVLDAQQQQQDNQNDNNNSSNRDVNLFVGLVSVTLTCFSSAFASVYFEKVVKKKPTSSEDRNNKSTTTTMTNNSNPSVWMRNIQLAFFSVIIAYFQSGVLEQPQKHSDTTTTTTTTIQSSSLVSSSSTLSYWHGFTAWVWLLVALQGVGGMLVAAVIKYADNVLKGVALGVSVIASSALSWLLFQTPLGMQFVMGSALIVGCVWFFSNPLPTTTTTMMRLLLEWTSTTTTSRRNNKSHKSSSSSDGGNLPPQMLRHAHA